MKKGMKKLSLLLCVILIVSICFTGCGNNNGDDAEAQDVYTLNACNLVPETDPIHMGMAYLKDLLEEKTDGRIKVEIYGNKSVSNSNDEEAQLVADGTTIQFTTTPAYVLAAMNESLVNFYVYDMPYLFDSYEEMYNWADTSEEYAKMQQDCIAATGIKPYGTTPIGWCLVSTAKKPIEDINSFKGQKIRTSSSDLTMTLINNIGANATPVAWGETFTAIQQGTVDGMYTASTLYASERYYEVVKYCAALKATTIPHTPILNNAWYEKLPDDLKVIFDECMDEYIAYFRGVNEQKDAEACATMEENGCKVVEFTDAQLQEFKDAEASMYETKAELIGGKDFLKSVQDFVAEYKSTK